MTKKKKQQDDKEDILDAIKQSQGNMSDAIAILGISRPTFYARIKQYNIKDDVAKIKAEFRSENAKKRREKKLFSVNKPSGKIRDLVIFDDEEHFLSKNMQKLLWETKGSGTSIYSLAFDQLSLRELMTATKKAYHDEEIKFKTYAYLMNYNHSTYAKITQTNEKIAQALIDGKTADERLHELQSYLNTFIQIIKDIANDLSIDRQDIAKEFIQRIREAAQASE